VTSCWNDFSKYNFFIRIL